jgi:hypothetical protein
MAAYDFSIRTKLAVWAAVGVLLVAGMLAVQQFGDYSAAQQRAAAESRQLAAIEALRVANDLRSMQIEAREIRLAIAPSEVDRALKRLHAQEVAAAGHKATEEIGVQIAGVQAATEDSVGIIKEIGSTIGRISEIAAAITTAVETQAVTTQQIAENVQAAAGSASRVAANIVDVNDSATEITSGSAQVLSSAQTLAQDGSRLSAEMEKFLVAVCAA